MRQIDARNKRHEQELNNVIGLTCLAPPIAPVCAAVGTGVAAGQCITGSGSLGDCATAGCALIKLPGVPQACRSIVGKAVQALPAQPCIDNPAIGFTCPSAPPPPPKPVTCPDGSTPAADGTCPTSTPPQQQQSLCPDGSTPAADGTCPPPPPSQSQGGQQSLSTSPPPDPCSQDPSSPGCQPTAPPPDNTPPPTSPYSWHGSSSHAPLKSA